MPKHPVLFMRSSSYGSFDICEQMHAIDYTLGIKPPASDKAAAGNVVHKALELLAAWKVAVQNGAASFADAELKATFAVKGFGEKEALNAGHDHYRDAEPHLNWSAWTFKKCAKWVNLALTMNQGAFDPRNRTVIAPETYFDFEVDEPWAAYSYDFPDGKVEGKLRLKGTVDLLTDLGDGLWEMIDWKTGTRKDWATDEVKDYRKLCKDFQLRLYSYAIRRVFPEARDLLATIVWVRDGGPYTVPIGPAEDAETLRMVRDRFEAIQATLVPRLIDPASPRARKCTTWCYFGTNAWPGTTRSICEHFKEEIASKGLHRVMRDQGAFAKVASYGTGGGATDRENKLTDLTGDQSGLG